MADSLELGRGRQAAILWYLVRLVAPMSHFGNVNIRPLDSAFPAKADLA